MTPLIFDLDGTLIDSAPDIHAAVNRLMAELGLAPLDLSTVISFIGNGLPVLAARVAAHRSLPEADVPDLTKRLLAHYDADPTGLTRPYPGVIDALQALQTRGHPMGICTNKPEAPARKVLSVFELSPFFDVVVGGDSCPTRKPEPDMLHAAITGLGHETCIYVGDSEVDAATAEAAGMPFLLFSEGYCHVPFAELKTAAEFSNWSDVPALVARLDS